MQYVIFAVSISFISWIVGIIGHTLIKNTSFYQRISNLNFLSSQKWNKWIGIDWFTWMVKNTFFKYFNQSIKIDKLSDVNDFGWLRDEMTKAEVGHLIGFAFVSVVAMYKGVTQSLLLALTIMVFNVLLNLFPSLLQQYNKRRLDRLVKVIKKRQKG